MSPHLILWPVLLQFLICFSLYIVLIRRKMAAVKAGEVDLRKTAIDPMAWTPSVQLVNNNLRNQFETPLIFVALCLMLFNLNAVSWLELTLAWVYMATRLGHLWIHIHSNYVPLRMRLFAAGLVTLLILTLLAANAVLDVKSGGLSGLMG